MIIFVLLADKNEEIIVIISKTVYFIIEIPNLVHHLVPSKPRFLKKINMFYNKQ